MNQLITKSLCVTILLSVLMLPFVVNGGTNSQLFLDSSPAFQADSTLAQFGVIYAILGNKDPDAGSLITIDESTGTGTMVGPTGISGEFNDPGIPALAIRSTGEIYVTDIGTSSNLYLVDAFTGEATLVGSTGLSSPPSLAFDGNGVLLAIDSNGDLYSIDHTSGESTFIATTGVFVKGMAVDPLTAVLWGCDASGFIYTIDKRTGAAVQVGNTGQDPSPDLCFTDANQIVASSGGGLSNNNLISIDQTTGAGTVIGSIGFRSVSGMGMRHDRVSPVALKTFHTCWVNDHVEITWRLAEFAGMLSYTITRMSLDDTEEIVFHDAPVQFRDNEFLFVDSSTEPGETYQYRVIIFENASPVVNFETMITTPPGRFALGQNYPNPFHPDTAIPFSLDRAQIVSLAIYDVQGKLVATLVDQRLMTAKKHTVNWDGCDAHGKPSAAGIYFFRLTAGKRIATRKSVLLR